MALVMASGLLAAMMAQTTPLAPGGSAWAQSPSTATIGGSIWVGSVDVSTGLPVMAPDADPATPDADPVSGASVMIQNQHSGGAVITYGTVDPTAPGNTWTATVSPGDYVVMFSAPGHDLTSREFTVAAGDVKRKDAYLAPMDLPTANLLVYNFYDNYVNGEDDAPDDPPMNGVTVTVKGKDGFKVTGLTGSQTTPMVLSDGTIITNTDGLYYFTGLPAGKVEVTSDPSTAYLHPQPIDPVTGRALGAKWLDTNGDELPDTGWGSTTEFYLMTSEEGGPAWDPALYPGDPGTEAGAYMVWHGFVEKIDQTGSPHNPTPDDTFGRGTISGRLLDADGALIPFDPTEPWPILGENHPGVTQNTVVPDGFVVLFSNAETDPVHPIATAKADSDGRFTFSNVPPGSYKLFLSDIPIKYVWNQAQVRLDPGGSVYVEPLIPRFFARAHGKVEDEFGHGMGGVTVNLRYKSGAIKSQQVTDANGFYNFDTLPEIEVLGFVDVTLPTGYRGTVIDDPVKYIEEYFFPGGTDEGHSNYVDPVWKTFNAMNRYIQWYTANYEANFYIEEVPASEGTIGGVIWDENLTPGTWTPDGTYDPMKERTLHGVKVELLDTFGDPVLDAFGDPVATTTGKVDEGDLESQGWIRPYTARLDEAGGVFVGPMPGYYEFHSVVPGNYQVRVTLPNGFYYSPTGAETSPTGTETHPVHHVEVTGGDYIEENFGAYTRVPQAGEIEGGVFDDLVIDNNPNSLLQFEKKGVPGVPVGVYDHLGYFLGSGTMGNPLCFDGSNPPKDPARPTCPAGEPPVQKPEMERRFAPGPHIYLGNDPSLDGYNPLYTPMALAYFFEQGQYRFEADWSLLPTAAVGLGGPLIPLNPPIINVGTPPIPIAATAGTTLTIHGTDFGATRDGSTVTLSGKKLEPVSWSDSQVVAMVPLDAVSGPLLVTTVTGTSEGATVTVAPAPLAGLALASLAVTPPTAVYVDASNTGLADGSQAKPWPTIGDALAHLPTLAPGAARDVFVAAGTYNEQVHLTQSDVRLIGTGPHETTVDGTMAANIVGQGVPNGGGPVFYIGQGPITGPVHNIEISGFTITGGSVADEIGAGIFAGLHNSNIDINNNMIVRNGGYYGGGIWFHKSVHNVNIWSNTIAENGNYGGYGGGISVNDEPEDPTVAEHTEPEHTVDDALGAASPGTYEIYNNLIFHNLSADYGGGISLYEVKDRLEVHDNMIIENLAWDHGGGLFIEDAGPTRIYGNVFLRNLSPDDGGAMSFEDHADGTNAAVTTPGPVGSPHQLEVFDNLIAENIADGHGENNARGGAIALDDTLDADIHHNTIVGNITASSEASAGGAIDSERNGHEYNGQMGPFIEPGYSDPLIHDNIIWDNWKLIYDQPNQGGEEDLGYTWGQNYRWTPDQLHVDNPAMQNEWETAKNSFSLTHVDNNLIKCGYPTGSGNFDSDPLFVDSGAFDWSLAAGSPAIAGGLGASSFPTIPTGILGAITMPVRDPGTASGCSAVPPAPSSGAGALTTLTGTPSAPLGVAVLAWNHHGLVSWLAPAAAGDTPISGYRVSASPGDSECTTADASTLTCDVGGLTNFTEYTFTVVATNLVGDGPGGLASATPEGPSCNTSTTPFTDMHGGFAAASIACLYNLGITTGTSPTTYSHGDAVTREQMAAFLARLWRTLSTSSPGTANPFTDISGSFATADIGFIFNLGVTKGTSGTTFSPGDTVSREQMAAFLARTWRALGGTCNWSATPFLDSSASFAATDIACIYHLGVTKGTSGTTFSPDAAVTREQVAAFLARLWQAATNRGL